MNIGDNRNFNFAKGKTFVIKDILKNADEPLEWVWDRGKCPHCNKDIKVTKNYTIGKVEILENEDGDIEMLGLTKELVSGVPLTMRLPNKEFFIEKDFEDKITLKSEYLTNKNKGA